MGKRYVFAREEQPDAVWHTRFAAGRAQAAWPGESDLSHC
jgi:hypothetical protein